MTQPGLLPYNRTPWEDAIERANAARYPLPTELVSAVWSPDNCPANLLSYLAWGLSVDIWDESWPETTKREVCRNALKLHRIKTTPAGIKAHVALTGATVNRIIRPPATTFARAAMTEAQRLAWLDGLPQIRIYPFATKSFAKARNFFNGKGVTRQFFRGSPHEPEALPVLTEQGGDGVLAGINLAAVSGDAINGTAWMRSTRGHRLFGRRATLYDRGTEKSVTLTGLEGLLAERILIGSPTSKRAFYGSGHLGFAYATASSAEANVYTVRGIDDAQTFAIEGALKPVDVRPKRIAQSRTAPSPRGFFGRKTFGRYMRASYAPLLIYDRIALNDPTRLGARRKVRGWYGHGRFGMPEFTAEVRVSVPMQRGKRRAARWMGVGFLKAPDMAPLEKAIQAVRVSKAFRDTVLIDTKNFQRVQFGGGLRFGEFTFGQIKEVE